MKASRKCVGLTIGRFRFLVGDLLIEAVRGRRELFHEIWVYGFHVIRFSEFSPELIYTAGRPSFDCRNPWTVGEL